VTYHSFKQILAAKQHCCAAMTIIVCALTKVVAAKMLTLQHTSTVDTTVVKKKFSRRYFALKLVDNYCIGLTIVGNE
jgi:hypothetical protein